jgi:cyclophilin family peptidyl-prolyl cis-trans isomerase
MKKLHRGLRGGLLAALVAAAGLTATRAHAGTIVRFETSLGNFDVQLFNGAMPRTVNNFLGYVTANKYDGTVVHRASDTQDTITSPLRDFVIQGGGFKVADPTGSQTTITRTSVVTDPAIADEPGGGVAGPSNVRGTIAMAKSGKNTATSQWFINQGNNSVLDSPARSDGGFAAFGRVLGDDGMAVVDAIGDLPIPSNLGFTIPSPLNDLPLRNFTGTKYADVRVANTVTVTDVRVLAVKAGDFDRDGSVGAADLAILRANYGRASNAFFNMGDANMDGRVNGADFLLWQKTAGSTGAIGSVVPEPGAAALLAAAGLALAAARRRGRRLG